MLASRPSADPTRKVRLLEAGRGALRNTGVDWAFRTMPKAGAAAVA
ncbi:MAG: hypothetical protein H7340_06820 [Variovorax sp.]|nr:hypothetical protein [Variovorax sp.]